MICGCAAIELSSLGLVWLSCARFVLVEGGGTMEGRVVHWVQLGPGVVMRWACGLSVGVGCA